MPLNFEFKAKTNSIAALEIKFQQLNARFVGEDYQTDTYFNALNGRLKLREGTIEHALIHYKREDKAGAKSSEVLLYQPRPGKQLNQVLTAAMGIKIVVEKKRRIWFVENVKIHFDRVEGLGEFVEVEAIDNDGTITLEKLKEQCGWFADFFDVGEEDYVGESYSDLFTKKITTAGAFR